MTPSVDVVLRPGAHRRGTRLFECPAVNRARDFTAPVEHCFVPPALPVFARRAKDVGHHCLLALTNGDPAEPVHRQLRQFDHRREYLPTDRAAGRQLEPLGTPLVRRSGASEPHRAADGVQLRSNGESEPLELAASTSLKRRPVVPRRARSKTGGAKTIRRLRARAAVGG